MVKGSFRQRNGMLCAGNVLLVLEGTLSTGELRSTYREFGEQPAPRGLEKFHRSLLPEQAHEELEMEALIACEKLAHEGLGFVPESRVWCIWALPKLIYSLHTARTDHSQDNHNATATTAPGIPENTSHTRRDGWPGTVRRKQSGTVAPDRCLQCRVPRCKYKACRAC